MFSLATTFLSFLAPSRVTAGLTPIQPVDLSYPFGARFNGGVSDRQSGLVVPIGDINKDGFGDFAVASIRGSCNPVGFINVVFGAPSFVSSTNLNNLTPPNGIKIWGETSNGKDEFGAVIAEEFDFNCDGTPDLGIAAPLANRTDGTTPGKVYVFYGPLFNTTNVSVLLNDSTKGLVFEGKLGGDYTGSFIAVSPMSPSNCSTILIGATEANGGNGGAYVVTGSPNINVTNPIQLSTLNGSIPVNGISGAQISTCPSDSLGQAWFGAAGAIGDFNGDDIFDYAVGAPHALFVGMIEVGLVSVIPGSKNFSSRIISCSNTSTYYSGDQPYNHAGISVAMNNKNQGFCSDLLFGINDATPLGRYYAGVTKLIACNNPTSIKTTFYGASAYDSSGGVVRFFDDMDNDSKPEIGIGAFHLTFNNLARRGATYIISSNQSLDSIVDFSNLSIVNGLIVYGDAAEQNIGTSIASVKNINGKGLNAVIVGAPGASPTLLAEGSSFLLYADSITLTNNQLFMNISDETSHIFTTNDLNASVLHDPAYIVYTITGVTQGYFANATSGVNITGFNQRSLENGEIMFVYNTSSKLPPSYSVVASHGWVTTAASPANVTFYTQWSNSNINAIFTKNNLAVTEGKPVQITSANLAADDPDNSQHNPQIVFKIVNASNGAFPAGNTFAQAAIAAQGVSFSPVGNQSPNYAVYASFGGVDIGPSFPNITFSNSPPTNQQTIIVGNPDNNNSIDNLRIGLGTGLGLGSTALGLLAYFLKRYLDRKEFKKKREILLAESDSDQQKLNQAWRQARNPLIKALLDELNMVGFCGSVKDSDIRAHIRAIETFLLKLQTANVNMEPPLSVRQKEILTKETAVINQSMKEQELKAINRQYVENVILTQVLSAAKIFSDSKRKCCCQAVLTAEELQAVLNERLVEKIKTSLSQDTPSDELELVGVVTEDKKDREEDSVTPVERLATVQTALQKEEDPNSLEYSHSDNSRKVVSFRRPSSPSTSEISTLKPNRRGSGPN